MFSRRRMTNRKVLVSLMSGNGISGVCTHDGRTTVVLRGAVVHQPDAEPAPADGELIIDRINIDYVQLL